MALNIKTNDAVVTDTKDVLGGNQMRTTGVYKDTIELAYVIESRKGATGIVLHLKDDNGSTLRTTVYITNRKGENFYTDRNGTAKELPGYQLVNAISLITTGKPLNQQDTEEKTIPLYNFEARTEVPTKVDVLDGLMGERIISGVVRIVENKKIEGDDGVYRPTSETIEKVELSRVFHPETGQTTIEMKADQPGEFIKKWSQVHNESFVKKNLADPATVVAGGSTPGVNTAPATPVFAGLFSGSN